MSSKAYCPGCESSTSSLREAFDSGMPCEYCGLSGDAWHEILTIQRARNDDDMAQRFTELRKENDKLISQLHEMHVKYNALQSKIRNAMGSML